MTALVEVRGLKVHFPIRDGLLVNRTVGMVKAVDGVDLDIAEGKTLGLVGSRAAASRRSDGHCCG